jgi:lysophospholipase L1-like esterase
MIEMARKQNPEVPIVICTLPPRDNPKAPMKPGAYEDLNARIAKLAAGKERIVVVDLAKALATPDGKFAAENFTEDRLHIAEPGYQKWAEAAKKAFEQLGLK